jgi:hypothetical protein
VKNLKFSFILACIFTILCISRLTLTIQAPEWIVDIGDSQTYVFTKVFDSRLTNPNHINIMGYSNDGQIEITLRAGTIVSYTISIVSPFSETVIGYRTYNNNVSLIEETISRIVRRTVNNRSYWEDYYEEDPLVHIQGNHIIREYKHYVAREESFLTYFLTEKSIWDFTTGWLVFSSLKADYMGETYYEVVYELLEIALQDSIFNLPLNTIFGSIMFLGLVTVLFGTRLYQQKLNFDKDK